MIQKMVHDLESGEILDSGGSNEKLVEDLLSGKSIEKCRITFYHLYILNYYTSHYWYHKKLSRAL